jgi:riboflavin biosynthesis pyrimidine reductase
MLQLGGETAAGISTIREVHGRPLTLSCRLWEAFAVRVLDSEHCPGFDVLVADHVALPESRGRDGAFIRLNMIASADGASALAGLSSGLGNSSDHTVFDSLRANADAVLVGMGTVIAEQYGPPKQPNLHIYVVASRPDVSGNAALFQSGRATLVLPDDAGPVPDGVTELRAGAGRVDLQQVVATLAGKVVLAEGGPTLAGRLVALGLVDEFFLTVSPRVISGDAARVVHGPDADPRLWQLRHGFVDDEGFLFLRYGRFAR